VKSANPTRIPSCRLPAVRLAGRQGTSYLSSVLCLPAGGGSSYPPTNKIPPEGPPQFCILHFDFCIFLYNCRGSSTNRPFFVQTNPILSASGGFKTLYPTKGYEKNAKFSPTKTNPNEPKQSQSDPRFSLTRAPQSQNERVRLIFLAHFLRLCYSLFYKEL
jgi:hypothetical protein